MYFLRSENNRLERTNKMQDNFILINEKADLAKVFSIKDKNFIIGSDSDNLIDEVYYLVNFLDCYKEIKEVLTNQMDNYNSNLKGEDNNYISEVINYFKDLNSDGKFIRGFLIVLGYKLMKEKNIENAIPLALAFEIFQTSVLIHDDIIDNALVRRGKKTISTRYKDKYNDLNLGNSMAICAGDLGFYKSFEIMIDNYSNNGKLLKYYNDVIINTIQGEILDVILSYVQKYKISNSDNLEEDVLDIYRLKTAWYSVIGPLCMGMILGEAEDEQIGLVEEFAYNLGLAFQIKDDILGIYSLRVKEEKTASDISEFKQTILYSYVYQKANNYLDELHKYYGKNTLSVEDVESVKNIFRESGALDYASKMMSNLFKRSSEILDNISFIDDEYKSILKGFIIYLENREH